MSTLKLRPGFYLRLSKTGLQTNNRSWITSSGRRTNVSLGIETLGIPIGMTIKGGVNIREYVELTRGLRCHMLLDLLLLRHILMIHTTLLITMMHGIHHPHQHKGVRNMLTHMLQHHQPLPHKAEVHVEHSVDLCLLHPPHNITHHQTPVQ